MRSAVLPIGFVKVAVMAILDFQVVREQDMSAEMDQRIRDALCVSFVKDAAYFSQKRGWKGSFPHWSVVGLDAGGFPAVHAGIIERDILVDGSELRILGVQNVYVLPEFRGKGLVAPLMQLVVDEGRRRAIATGLLFCKPVVEKVYIRLGWKRLEVQKSLRLRTMASAKNGFWRTMRCSIILYAAMWYLQESWTYADPIGRIFVPDTNIQGSFKMQIYWGKLAIRAQGSDRLVSGTNIQRKLKIMGKTITTNAAQTA